MVVVWGQVGGCGCVRVARVRGHGVGMLPASGWLEKSCVPAGGMLPFGWVGGESVCSQTAGWGERARVAQPTHGHAHRHLLLPLVERRVVDDALAKDGDREAVDRRLIENLVLGLDKLELRPRADHEGDALRAHADREHRAVARAQRVDHADGPLDKVEQ
eukprot:7381300-Prymnesium_polylepis.1